MKTEKKRTHCPNMNHGKTNPPIKYCPQCGEKFKTDAGGTCNQEKHYASLKQKGIYCHDCGGDLRKILKIGPLR